MTGGESGNFFDQKRQFAGLEALRGDRFSLIVRYPVSCGGKRLWDHCKFGPSPGKGVTDVYFAGLHGG